MRKRLALLGAVGALVLLVASAAPASSSQPSSIHSFNHVFVIMMENTGIESLLGNPNAPWINQAVETYGVAGNYYGVAHPSQPNYIAATSGSTNGVTSDANTTIDVPNIVDQLESHGKSWKAYMQSYALCNGNALATSCGNQLYERKHNPFISYLDVQSNATRVAKIVDFSQFATDLAGNDTPDFSWISPDQCNDMHGRGGGGPTDPCDFSNEQSLIQTGDTFLSNTVGQIMASKAWGPNSVIFITWDESDFTGTGPAGFGDTRGCCDANPGGGHVLTLAITDSPHQPRASMIPFNHYSLLGTIEDAWHLGCLANTCDTLNVPRMGDLVSQGS